MAVFFYNICQNVYKNIFYICATKKINDGLNINYYLLKHIVDLANKEYTINSQFVDRHITSKDTFITKPSSYKIGLLNTELLSSIQKCQVITRNFSSMPLPEEKPPKRSLPPIMDFPEIIWPSLFKSIRNWILAKLIIAPYFDRDFSLHDFVIGSKKALEVVSNHLSAGNYKELDGLVTQDALNTIMKSASQLSLAQRQQLGIDNRDIYFSFPYQVGIMFDESDSSTQKRFVEITMVYHVLHGLNLMRERGEEPPVNVGVMPEFRDKIHICNYRFIKEFTKGVDDQWTINLINHFKPSDFV